MIYVFTAALVLLDFYITAFITILLWSIYKEKIKRILNRIAEVHRHNWNIDKKRIKRLANRVRGERK